MNPVRSYSENCWRFYGHSHNLVTGSICGKHLRYVRCAIRKLVRTNQFRGALPVISKCIYVCLHNDEQAVSIPVCRACASGPDPDGRELEPSEAPCPTDGEQRIEEREDVPTEGPPLDSTGVVPCPTHGMDHLTRDPSCEFCKRALGPLYRHLKGKYGTRLDDQTPTLSFDFSGPFPVSATGARFMLLFVWRLMDIRLLWAFALDRRTKENVRSCLQDVMAELTIDGRFQATSDEGPFRSSRRVPLICCNGMAQTA